VRNQSWTVLSETRETRSSREQAIAISQNKNNKQRNKKIIE
jgi:hypothetical protein